MTCPYCNDTDHSSLGKCPRWTEAKFRVPPVCAAWTDADWIHAAEGPVQPAPDPLDERQHPLTQPGAP